MWSIIRRRVTYANVVVTFALVFAMAGGAYAAKFIITSAKQISPKAQAELAKKMGKAGKRGPIGPTGPVGPAGATGAPGKDGLNGAPGKDGSNGTNGESVTAKAVLTTETGKCEGLGGVEYTLAAKTTLICNGQTGFTETLPSGKTLKGDWSVVVNASGSGFEGLGFTSVSFDIPLSEAPTPHYIRVEEETPEGCTGNAHEPGAEPGQLCVFATGEINMLAEIGANKLPIVCSVANGGICVVSSPGADKMGFGVATIAKEKGLSAAFGSWAVTAK